jgi:DNA repair exonuclease SbcCD ATPase subunit
MKKLVLVVLLLLVGVAALGYSRGWFNGTREGNVQVDSEKFKKDKENFSQTVGEKSNGMKNKIANLWKTSDGLMGDDKAETKKELSELEKKHERLEKQLKELEEAGEDRFDGLKHDIAKSLEEVEQKIEELTQKLSKAKNK